MDDEMNTIKEQFSQLPKEIQQAVTSFNWPAKLKEIGGKNGLHVDQIGDLENEVMLVLIGTIAPDDFANQLKKNSSIPEDKIGAVINDSNEMIFKPIRESLAKIYEENLTEKDLEELPAPASSADEEALKASGVEIISAGAEIRPKTEAQIPKPEAPKNIVEDKMSAPFRMPKQETDLSIPKTPAQEQKDLPTPGITAPSVPKIDPYKEKI